MFEVTRKQTSIGGVVYAVVPGPGLPGGSTVIRVNDDYGTNHEFVVPEGRYERGDDVMLTVERVKRR